MSKNSEWMRSARKRTKKRIVEAFDGKCCICGYDKCLSSLALHHLDPSEKELAISGWRATPTIWGKIVNEMRKCVLVCHNCHNEIHDDECETEVPDDAIRFNEEYADFDFNRDASEFDKCPVCGETKRKENKTCSYKCGASFTKSVDWDNIDLPSLIGEFGSSIKIAEHLNLSPAAVDKRLKRLNLSINPQ